ncbi:MAG: tRNA pseudouridine synthase A [Thermoplasmata archaeon]
MRWLVRFGYDGRSFAGWARQPGLRTVEGELLRGLVRLGVAPSAEAARVAVASRTDRGVSARANAFVVSTDLPSGVLLLSLNGISTELTCSAATPVSEEFRVRGATRRTYRYFEPLGAYHPERWERAARLFSGTIDVRSFGRGLPAGVPVLRSVESITVTSVKGGLMVEIRAPSFVWGMVRKVIAALREYDAGRLTLVRLEAALKGQVRLTLPMAEPEGLVLWEVEYPVPWTLTWNGLNRHQEARARSQRDSLWVQSEVLKALATP